MNKSVMLTLCCRTIPWRRYRQGEESSFQ